MKKFLTILLVLAAAGGASAQWVVSPLIEMRPDLMYMSSPTGEAAKAQSEYRTNTAALYGGAGAFEFLSSKTNYYGTNDVKLRFNYSGGEGKYKAYVRFNLANMIGTNGSLFTGTTSMNTVLALPIDEYYIRGKVGDYFEGYVGNTSDRGKTDTYRYAFSSFLKNKIDGFGLLAPAYSSSTLGFNDNDNNNLQRQFSAKTAEQPARADKPYLAFYGYYSPFTLTLAGDYSFVEGYYDAADKSHTNAAGMIRFSGEKVAGLVTFDVLYRFTSYDQNTDTNTADTTTDPETSGNPYDQPYGAGYGSHSFGVYAGLNPIPGLGVSVGYTGYLRTEKDKRATADIVQSAAHPFYSGIDLRAQYTGVPNLTISLHNNVTFASIDGTDSADLTKYNKPIVSVAPVWNQDSSQSWFALYNALRLTYKVNAQFSADLQVGNRWGKLSGDYKTGAGNLSYAYSVDVLSGGLSASYSFDSNVSISTGLMATLTNYGFEGENLNQKNPTDSDSYSTGVFELAIPIVFKITW